MSIAENGFVKRKNEGDIGQCRLQMKFIWKRRRHVNVSPSDKNGISYYRLQENYTHFNSKTIMRLHRNSQKRYYQENLIYFIVTKTFENFPYFKEPIFCDLLIEDLKICKKLKKFKLYGFCLIYDHLNLLIHPNEEFNVSKIMQFLKRHLSRNINYVIDINNEGDIG
jgi:REP element-mobilizing transposase RayT